MAGRRGTIYLLHFARPYKHARHYLGFAEDLERRLKNQRNAPARLCPICRGEPPDR